ncbi:hypothetical protein GP486_002816 [Trichoglossum hirsutum]|uniref:Sexual development protein n=1 Tax=Trichoglossum hirsutum TaxID=265104 RepID=A0A9P8LDM8_9PEZI|nr:hypothetical protein GP486_002816 [Trichoglossum hirsutum]
MRSSISLASLAGLSCLSSVVSAAPFSFPLSDGFPNIQNPSQQLNAIQEKAHGSIPNGTPPPSIKNDTLTSLRFIAFNEIAEVAFFSEFKNNVTSNAKGFEIQGKDRDTLLAALDAILAQEELHAINANGAVAKFGGQAIQPCKYNFPVNSLNEAIGFASTATDLVLGTLQDVESLLGTAGDLGLLRGVASVIGQEGEQNGFYRTLLHKIPSELPFLTTSTREFAFSALNQLVVVPGSCPNSKDITLPIFQPLTVETKNIEAKSQNLKFSFTIPDNNNNNNNDSNYKSTPPPGYKSDSPDYMNKNYRRSDNTDYSSAFSLTYINQQNTPVVQKLQNVQVDGNTIHFEALFPFDQGKFGNGLTIAALTKGAGPFANAPEVAKNTIAGPGLIIIN